MKSYLTILVCLVIFFAAYNSVIGSDANPAEPNTTSETAADSVAVTVNGIDINESQIEAQVKSQLEKMAARVPPVFVEQYKKQLRQQVMDRIIVEQLLGEKVKEKKIVVTEEEVIDHIKEMASQQQPPLLLEDFKALIEAYGKSFDEIKQQVRKGLSYQKLLQTQFAGRINITEDDARKYYSENKKQIEEVRASHILIKPDTTNSNADPNQAKAKAKAKTKNLLKQIKDGADFATLARATGGYPSAPKGGDLGFFSRGRMVPAFEKVAFELKAGQVSDIVETQFGYHIIKVTDRKNDTFEQAKDDILKVLTQTRQGELAKEYFDALKAKANIVYPAGKEPKAPARPSIMAPPRPRPTPQPKDKTVVE